MRIFYFNPYNDLALAAPSGHFTPPVSALAVEQAGSALPLWWAGTDDVVLVRDEATLLMARRIASQYGLPDVAAVKVPDSVCATLHPWGWSQHAASLFDRAGGAALLPSEQWIEEMKMLSHRRTSIEVLRRMGWDKTLIPVEARTADEALSQYTLWGKAVMKLPWSGSGRGVMLAHEIPLTTLRGYIEGVIRRQGSIIVEPYYKRNLDFAMLFEITDKVAFTGFSVFAADSRGRYTGNVVAPQQELLLMLPPEVVPLTHSVAEALSPIAEAGYRGPVGVDMMMYDTDSGTAIMPCIEVNLRYTMGMVAAQLAGKGLHGVLRFGLHPKGQTVSGSGPCFNIE